MTDDEILSAGINAADALDATRVHKMQDGGWHPTTIFDGDSGLLRFGRLVEAAVRREYVSVPSVIEQHGLCVAYRFKDKIWGAQDCRYNALEEGATLDEAVQKLMPKLIRCQRCQMTTTRTVHEHYCKAADCEVRSTCENGEGKA